jgi:DNA end-binding protein Ku
LKELDPISIEKTYFVLTDDKAKTTTKAFALLHTLLKKEKKMAIASITFREREHVAALRPYQRGFILHLLHYTDELRPLPERAKLAEVTAQELETGKQLLAAYTSESLDLTKYHDRYSEEVQKLVDSKLKGKKYTVVAEQVKKQEPEDLIQVLKASIEGKKKE